MKTAVVMMVIIFALCVGVSMGGDNAPQEGKRLAVNKVAASSKMVDYDSDYDEVVTKENTVKSTEGHSEKSPRYSTDEINTEVIQ